jgi:hypothetical protein
VIDEEFSTGSYRGEISVNEFGQKSVVPLAERLSLSPEEASALTGIGLTSIRQAAASGALTARKHGCGRLSCRMT